MTSLLSGERVSKSHERMEACGDLDELGSVLGAFAAVLPDPLSALRSEVHGIQGELLHIGAWVGTAPDSAAAAALRGFTGGPLEAPEASIDGMEKTLPPLASFILAGGHPSAAWAHVARTVCRRAEKHVARSSDGCNTVTDHPLPQPFVHLSLCGGTVLQPDLRDLRYPVEGLTRVRRFLAHAW